jgi:hypothetical protein
LGLGGWIFYLLCFGPERSQDWMVYHTAARAWLDGNLPLVFDGDRFTALINQRYAHILSRPLQLHPWLYPPHYLLLLLPFGALPFDLAGGLFLLLSFAALIAAAWRYAGNGTERALYAFSLLLCPASAVSVCLGQNTFLSAALLVGGMSLLPRRPLWGGALLGILTYKPQLWLLVPIALIAARQWKALGAAAGTALVLMGASAAVFGIDTWRHWFQLMTAPSTLYDHWLVVARLNGQSVYTCAALLGAPPQFANLAQGLSAIVAAAAVFWSWRKPLPDELRLAVLLAATMLAAPHVIDYDAVLPGFGAVLFFAYGLRNGIRPVEATIAALLWLSPLINPPSVFHAGLVTPLLIALFIATAMARGTRSESFSPVNRVPQAA